MINKFKELGSHAVVYGSSLIISKALGFLLIPLYANNLSTAEYGIIALLDFTVNILALVIGCNINDAIMKFYNDADVFNVKPSVVITTALSVITITSFVGCSLLMLNARSISYLVFNNYIYSQYFIIVFSTLFFELVLNIPLQYVRVLNKSKLYAIVNIARTIISLSLNIAFILYYKLGILGVLYTNLIVNSVFCCLLLLWLKREAAIRFSKQVAIELIKFSLPLIPAGIAATCLQSADIYILKQMSNPSQVGIYSFGYKFGIILGVLVQTPFGLVWGPIAYRVVKEEGGLDFIAKVMTYYNFISVTVALCIALFIKDVIQMMSAQSYHVAAYCVPLVLLGYVFFGMAGIFHLGILVNKKTKASMYITILTATVNILLNISLIPLFDDNYKFIAPAITTTISFIILATLRAYYSNKLLPIKYEYYRLFKLMSIAILIYGISFTIETRSLSVNLIIKSIMLLAFFMCLLISKFFHKNELDQARLFIVARFMKLRISE